MRPKLLSSIPLLLLLSVAGPMPAALLAAPGGPRQIGFAGYDWTVKSGDLLGPGPNYFSESEENVWVDASDRLHMKIALRDGRWYCSEIIANGSLGYGRYVYTLESRVDQLDENVVVGLFTWDTNAPQFHYREIDIEFSRWTDPQNEPAQYVVQPYDTPGNIHRFDIAYSGFTETTTHVMTWGPQGIEFTSYYGGFTPSPRPSDLIESWSYAGSDDPPPGGENARINFWLFWGLPPANGQDAEIVISDFRYQPLADCEDGLDNDGDGFTDHPNDPGCAAPASTLEDPKCQDGLDNDGDERIDYDGGLSVLGPGHSDLTAPDPQCLGLPGKDREGNRCGLGFELALLLPLLRGLHGLRSRSKPWTTLCS